MFKKTIVTNYYISTQKPDFHPTKIGLVTDLHEEDPTELIDLLKKEKPDLILVAGDTLERHEEGKEGHTMKEIDSYQEISPFWSSFCRFLKIFHRILGIFRIKYYKNEECGHKFLREASKIAPVYLSKGNHEWYFLPEDIDLMKECHIKALDNEDCRLSLLGNEFLIGGLSTMHDIQWLDSFSQKEGFKILLCHHPEYYKRFIFSKGDSFDLVVSGHAHGGQWRIGGRGILAPGQGFLPIFHHGQYSKLIVSAGVSNPSVIPRFGNPKELVMIHLR